MSHAELAPFPSSPDPGIPPNVKLSPERPVSRRLPRRPPAESPRAPIAPGALSRHACESLLVSHLHVINRIATAAARRSRLTTEEAEDFAGIVRLKLVQNDYTILRQYRQRSALGTFLTVVIKRMLLDHCRSRWGRWRPTVGARRQGPGAVLLERLTTRDSLTLDQAAHLIGTTPVGLTAMRAESATAAANRPRLVGLDAAADVATPRTDYDERVLCGEVLQTAARSRRALSSALRKLKPADRRLLALRFVSALSVADIARKLSTPQKPLYRRIDKLLAHMRDDLERAGLSAEDIRRV